MKAYVMTFIVGGIFCAIAQILLNKTQMKTAHILVTYVVGGVVLSVLGIYEKIIDIGYAGATTPIIGWGHALMQGTIAQIEAEGLIGVFTGGLTAAGGGVAAVLLFGFIMALLFNPKTKK